VTSYEAAYVVLLAEALDSPLLTRDSRLARSSGHAAAIVAFPPAPGARSDWS
jgi:predicted nucleic acid-binding protein